MRMIRRRMVTSVQVDHPHQVVILHAEYDQVATFLNVQGKRRLHVKRYRRRETRNIRILHAVGIIVFRLRQCSRAQRQPRKLTRRQLKVAGIVDKLHVLRHLVHQHLAKRFTPEFRLPKSGQAMQVLGRNEAGKNCQADKADRACWLHDIVLLVGTAAIRRIDGRPAIGKFKDTQCDIRRTVTGRETNGGDASPGLRVSWRPPLAPQCTGTGPLDGPAFAFPFDVGPGQVNDTVRVVKTESLHRAGH